MKILILIAILTAAAPVLSQDESFTIGAFDFYGRDGLDTSLIRAALPLREGDQLSRGSKDRMVRRIKRAIRQATGREVSEASASIPGECFVGLLNSGLWTDRNKSAELLSVLTAHRDPMIITCLREQALTSLVEMARWSFTGHAQSARFMLGRIVGIDEKTLIGTIERNEVEPIINALTTQQSNGEDAKRCPLCKH